MSACGSRAASSPSVSRTTSGQKSGAHIQPPSTPEEIAAFKTAAGIPEAGAEFNAERSRFDAERAALAAAEARGREAGIEEAATLRAALRRFHNMVIVGASYTRACDRLAAIKRECEINQQLIDCFGGLRGPIWQEGKIVLANG